MAKRGPKWTPLRVFQAFHDGAAFSWCWSLHSRNGNTLADAGGYNTRSGARAGFRAAAKLAALALKDMERK